MEISKNKVVEGIKKGATVACNDIFDFCESSDAPNAEFLFQYNIAKAVSGGPFKNYKIFLEHSTAKFASEAPPPFAESTIPMRSVIRKERQDTGRSGRVDIAIYRSKILDSPYCAIEVKGFDPGVDLVLKDLRRNLELMTIVDPATGKSQIELTAFVGFKSYKKYRASSEEGKAMDKLKKLYSSYVDRFKNQNSVPNEVEISIEIFRASKNFLDDHDPTVLEEEPEDIHLYLGAIILMEWNDPSE